MLHQWQGFKIITVEVKHYWMAWVKATGTKQQVYYSWFLDALYYQAVLEIMKQAFRIFLMDNINRHNLQIIINIF